MAIEKKWEAIPALAFSSDGTAEGLVTIPSTAGFKTKHEVLIKATALSGLALEVKRVLSETTLLVGPRGKNLSTYTDLTAYTVLASATIEAAEQPRPSIPDKEFERAVFEEEPAVAKRVILVDELGRKINEENPLPTTATLSGDISIGTDGFHASSPDSMLATGSEDGTKTGSKHALKVKPDGTLKTDSSDTVQPVSASALPLPTGAATEAKQDVANASLASIDGKLTAPLAVSGPLTNAELRASPVPVTGTLNADLDAFSATPDNVMLVGTQDGSKTGAKFGFVNNLKTQILSAHDRTQAIVYADFGTKNQRVTGIDYQSATFPGVTARKVISYTLVGNRYRRDSINWILV